MRGLCIVLLCCCCALLSGQAKRDRISAVTIRGNLGIPKPLSSARFYQSFAGVFEGNASVSARLAGNVSVGAGYQGSAFKNNDFFKRQMFQASLPYNTGLNGNSGFMRLGYDHFFKQNAFTAYALNVGYMFCQYTNVNPDSTFHNLPIQPKTFSAPFVQGEFSVNWVMEQRLAFSFFLSYSTLMHKFDARAPRFNQFSEIRKKTNNYMMSYLNLGFGFTVLLGN